MGGISTDCSTIINLVLNVISYIKTITPWYVERKEEKQKQCTMKCLVWIDLVYCMYIINYVRKGVQLKQTNTASFMSSVDLQ